MTSNPIRSRVFISYSRKDQDWLDQLVAHLRPLQQEGVIQPWIDTGKIEFGDRYNEEIAAAIDTCGAAILLVSPHFQNSGFIQDKELPRLLDRAKPGEMRLYWLLVSDCMLGTKLGKTYHCANNSQQPLDEMTAGQVNKVLANLARDLEQWMLGPLQDAPRPVVTQKPAVPVVAAAAPVRVAAPTRDRPFSNSLGIPFLPVPGARGWFGQWPVRVQDYARFAAENPGADGSWKNVEFKGHRQGPDHPVVNVSWEDAQAFCAWLSGKENRVYRLPTDHEWSLAVGIGDRENPSASPKEKDGKIKGVYPWGTQWPPPKGAGNYAGEEVKALGLNAIEGYRDEHSFTSPVGSYAPNRLGLHDLGGNVWEWCEDKFDRGWFGGSSRVLRGASWDRNGPDRLLSSSRNRVGPAFRYSYYGFRLVLEGGGER